MNVAQTEKKSTPIVGIGASAGGLEALREVFQGTDDGAGMAFVVVQHLDPTHESLMAQLLERYTSMTVRQATGGEKIAAGHVYVIPPGSGLAITDGVLKLTEFRDPRGLRRPIDDFFESLAEDQGPNAACVILSGTGGDGTRGLRAIKEHGGLAVVQTPESARYDGMPTSAIGTGLVDVVAPPDSVITALRNFFEHASRLVLSVEAEEAVDHIDGMCAAVQEAVGHDFSGYKRSTLSRRIARRMQVRGISDASEYLALLRGEAGECEALFRDLLINVTRFFREREEFNRLADLVIDPLVQDSRTGGEIRVWVPGCSSGEEAYTIAMLFAQAMRRFDKRPYVQIFATDIDEKMLEIARGATYPLSALKDIPTDLQSEYVLLSADHFTLTPHIREMVRFSLHNVIRDPPYSKIDLVSCRNLLIYFDEELQRQVIPTFHFALRDTGKLFLGASETIGRFEDLFAATAPRSRIYDRRSAPSRFSLALGRRSVRAFRPPAEGTAATVSQEPAELRALKRIAAAYGPVTMLVDREGLLLDNWGPIGRYLDFPDRGDAQVEVTRQLKPGLREIVGPLLRDAADQNRRRLARDVQVRTDFGIQQVSVIADPIGTGTYLLVIREEGPVRIEDFDALDEFERGDSEVRYLQDELANSRMRLRTTVEELETTNEELKSSNEEMMSMNEELQSTNEELTTVNDELKSKVDQVTLANADLKNFFESTELAVVVVDAGLKLRSFTEAAAGLFASDCMVPGQALKTLPHNLADDRFHGLAARAVAGERPAEEQIDTIDGRHLILRALPYRRLDGSVDGATLVFSDVTATLGLQTDLIEERARLRMALEVARIGVWQYEPATDRLELDATERGLLGVASADPGPTMAEVLAKMPPDDRDRVSDALRRAADGAVGYDETFRVTQADGGTRWLHGLGRSIAAGDTRKFIGVTYDITAEREQVAQRELMIREMNHRVKNLFAVISSLIAVSRRRGGSLEDFTEELQERILALGRAHGLTANEASGEVGLAELLHAAIDPSTTTQRLVLDGPATVLPNRYVTPLALIFHEWATNAVKYGALSARDGKLSVEWRMQGGFVTIDWCEQGAISPGTSQPGFGTQLVSATVRQINGTLDNRVEEGRFSYRLRFPLG